MFNSFCTINVPLLRKNETNNESFDGVNTLENEENSTIIVNDAALFCCRGIKTDCHCVQMRFKELKFKKITINDEYPIGGIYLNKWPYEINHGPREKDQLSNAIGELQERQQQQQQQLSEKEQHSPPPCHLCNDKYTDQKCFYQSLSLIGNT